MNIEICKTLRATFTDPDTSKQAINYAQDKEMIDTYNLVVNHKGELENVIVVRCYMGRSASASVVYVSAWITCADDTWRTGRGSAGGYGYCKTSTAIGEALRAAGVRLFGKPYVFTDQPVDMKKPFHMDGTGISSLDVILVSVARAAGYRGSMIVIHN